MLGEANQASYLIESPAVILEVAQQGAYRAEHKKWQQGGSKQNNNNNKFKKKNLKKKFKKKKVKKLKIKTPSHTNTAVRQQKKKL